MSEGDERFQKNGLNRKKIRDFSGKKALARGVALLGVKVTGIDPPLTFVTVYRLPIRLPAKSALTWPVV